jgi:type IV pilus assembly protein PilB
MKLVTNKNPVIEALLKASRLTNEQLKQAEIESQSTNENIEQVVVSMGLLKEDEIGTLLENYFRVPYVDLAKLKIEQEILNLVPENIIKEYDVIPIAKKNNELTLAMSLPNDVVALDYIRLFTGYDVKPVVTLKKSIWQFIEQFYAPDAMGQKIKEINLSQINLSQEELFSGQLKELAKHATIVQLVDTIFTQAVRMRASDIHLEPQAKDLFTRYRIDGQLHTIESLPKEIQAVITSRIKIMANMDIAERRLPQDGQIQLKVGARDIDFRVSTLPGKYGEKLVIRVLDKTGFSFGIETLGFLPETQSQFEEIIRAPNGIILVTGPTGSGKTTTLYAVLNRLKSPAKNVITLEDPIEYELLSGRTKEAGITQVQINPKIGLTFAAGLKASLRQDPDVILVGEIRDEETMRVSINSALTGHLVLSTLHTNDTVSTIIRLLEMNVEPYLINSSLVAILAQRLVRVLCPSCRESYAVPKRVLERMKLSADQLKENVFYRPKGCDQCSYTGYHGRTAIFELLIMNDQIRTLIISTPVTRLIREEAKKAGLMTLKDHGMRLVSSGVTSVAEVLRIVPSEL